MDLQADHKTKMTDEREKVNKRPRTATDHKRKRVDEGKKEKKRPRTAAVDEAFQFQSKDVASGGHPRKEKRRRPDVGNRESSRKRKVDLIKDDNMFDRSTEASVDDGARKIHAMQRLMSAVDGLMSVVDGESNPEDLISLTDEIEYFNKIQNKIVELKQKVVELKQKSLKKREANWSELPNELLESILKKLIPSEFDIIGFRHIREFKAVCQSWRAAAKSCSSYVPLPRTPCLLLHGETQNSFLFDPIGKKKHEIRNVHDYTPRPRCVGSSYGWIVMFYEDNELKESKSKAHLFNPITRGRISIPGAQNLPSYCRTPRKAIISSNPSFNKNFVVVVQFGVRLAYYKHGDEDMSWKMLKVDVDGADYNDEDDYGDEGFVFHDNLLVALANKFTNVWDFKKYPPLHRSSTKNSSTAKFFTYLMESSLTGDILGLKKEGENNKTLKFGVEKLDLQKGKWENLQSLGDQSLFFFSFFGGWRQWQLMSMVNPCFLGCEKNSIYFAMIELVESAALDKYTIYDIEKGKIKSLGEKGMIKSFCEDVHINFGNEPLWIIPNPW